MTQLYIDNHPADLDPRAEISISISMASLTSTSLGRASYSKSITIPTTPRNRALMGDCEQPLSSKMFNHTAHTARVEVDGCVIIEGNIFLTASQTGDDGYYRFYIIGNSREWVVAASRTLESLPVGWSATLDVQTIDESQRCEEHPLVRFLPVERSRGVQPNGNPKPLFFNRVTFDHYHPFVHIATLVEKIFALAGYAVESDFFRSEFFRSLYMSGRWNERPNVDWGENMDFLATRADDSLVVAADTLGMVYADPLANENTVGNIVDRIDKGAPGVIAFDETERLKFTPTADLNVAFEFYLRFRTDYRIQDRYTLQGLTLLMPNVGDEVAIPITNHYHDFRGDVMHSGYDYNLVIFEPAAGATYTLLAEEIINPQADPANLSPSDVREVTILSDVAERFTHFVVTTEGNILNPRLVMMLNGFLFSPASDWALYTGNVTERGNVNVEVTFPTKAHRASPLKPHHMDMFVFGGGEEGQTLQLLAGSTVRPLLITTPEMGDTLAWGDVMHYTDVTGMDLIAALRELFDLQIYTDPFDKKVCIEPRREYCDPDVVIDLSERIDLSRGVVVEELGGDHPKNLKVGYRQGDRASAEREEHLGKEWGSWSVPLCNIFASEGSRAVTNRLFTAGVDVEGTVAMAPSAHLVRVGDSRDKELHPAMLRRNFLPKIVSYRGMKRLPVGEQWDFPLANDTHYPLLTFFDNGSVGGEERSLLVCDYLGVEGLHKWWDHRVEALNYSRRLTLYVTLRPEEVEQIVVPNSTKHDFRAHYLLSFDGEKVLCRLEEIVDYNPNSPSTKVVFTTV